jgi:hypothetical protein
MIFTVVFLHVAKDCEGFRGLIARKQRCDHVRATFFTPTAELDRIAGWTIGADSVFPVGLRARDALALSQ